MIRHVVLLRFVTDADEVAIQRYISAVAQLPTQVPGVVDFTFGRDIGKARAPELAQNWDFVVSATFDDFADYRHYAEHPAHRSLVETYLIGLVAERAALQIESSGTGVPDDV